MFVQYWEYNFNIKYIIIFLTDVVHKCWSVHDFVVLDSGRKAVIFIESRTG